MFRRHSESEVFCNTTGLDFTDGGRTEDKRLTGGKKRAENKLNMKFQSILPCREQPVSSFAEYRQTPQATRSIKHSRANKPCDSYTPYFQIMSVPHLPVTLSYSDVIETLLEVVLLIYNKLTEIKHTDLSSSKLLAQFLRSIDESICTYILRPILSDLGLCARRKSEMAVI